MRYTSRAIFFLYLLSTSFVIFSTYFFHRRNANFLFLEHTDCALWMASLLLLRLLLLVVVNASAATTATFDSYNNFSRFFFLSLCTLFLIHFRFHRQLKCLNAVILVHALDDYHYFYWPNVMIETFYLIEIHFSFDIFFLVFVSCFLFYFFSLLILHLSLVA